MKIDDMRVGDFLHLLDCMQEECYEHKRCDKCRYHDICCSDIGSIETISLRQTVESYAEMNGLLNHMNYVNNQKWIPCSEKLPDYDELVIATDDCYRVFIAWYSVIHGWCSDRYGCCYVVAWMPLPEPYTPYKGDTE